MHNEALCKSSLKIIRSITRQGREQRRGEETMMTMGFKVGLEKGSQKAGENKNQLLVFLVLFKVKSCFKLFGSVWSFPLGDRGAFFLSFLDFLYLLKFPEKLDTQKWDWEPRGTQQKPSAQLPFSQQKELSAIWPKWERQESHINRMLENPNTEQVSWQKHRKNQMLMNSLSGHSEQPSVVQILRNE